MGDLASLLSSLGLSALLPVLEEEALTVPLLRSMGDVSRCLMELGIKSADAERIADALRATPNSKQAGKVRPAPPPEPSTEPKAKCKPEPRDINRPLEVVYINLAKRLDRKARMEATLPETGLIAERFAALTGADVPTCDVVHTWDTSRNAKHDLNCAKETLKMSAGERGCCASHLALWRRCAERGAPLLILEDDAEVTQGTGEVVRRIVATVQNNLEPRDRHVIVYLGADVSRWRDAGNTLRAQQVIWSARSLGVNLREAAWAWQTHAYIIWPPAARTFLEAAPVHSPVDVYMSCFLEDRRVTALVAQPQVAWQVNPYKDGDVVHSSLEKRQKMPGWDAAVAQSLERSARERAQVG